MALFKKNVPFKQLIIISLKLNITSSHIHNSFKCFPLFSIHSQRIFSEKSGKIPHGGVRPALRGKIGRAPGSSLICAFYFGFGSPCPLLGIFFPLVPALIFLPE